MLEPRKFYEYPDKELIACTGVIVTERAAWEFRPPSWLTGKIIKAKTFEELVERMGELYQEHLPPGFGQVRPTDFDGVPLRILKDKYINVRFRFYRIERDTKSFSFLFNKSVASFTQAVTSAIELYQLTVELEQSIVTKRDNNAVVRGAITFGYQKAISDLLPSEHISSLSIPRRNVMELKREFDSEQRETAKDD